MTTEKTATKFSKIERISAAAGIFIFLGGAFYVWFFDPTTEGIFPACPLLKYTGLACPGCGLTRAFHAALHGDVLTALDFNLLFPVYMFALFYVFLAIIKIALGGRRGLPTKYFSPYLLGGFVVVALVFGVVRNLPYHPFNVLYP